MHQFEARESLPVLLIGNIRNGFRVFSVALVGLIIRAAGPNLRYRVNIRRCPEGFLLK